MASNQATESSLVSNPENSEKDHQHDDSCCKDGEDKNGHKIPSVFDVVKSG